MLATFQIKECEHIVFSKAIWRPPQMPKSWPCSVGIHNCYICEAKLTSTHLWLQQPAAGLVSSYSFPQSPNDSGPCLYDLIPGLELKSCLAHCWHLIIFAKVTEITKMGCEGHHPFMKIDLAGKLNFSKGQFLY